MAYDWVDGGKRFLRAVAGAIWLFSYLMMLVVLLPLRALNPVWRMVGFTQNRLPTDILQQILAKTFLAVLGIELTTEGENNIPVDQPVIYLYNHVSSLDPFTVMGAAPVPAKFIFKRELMFWVPPLGLTAYFYGHIPIDRKNQKSAIKSMDKAGRKMKKYKRSVAIAPEGTRSHTGELGPFKKGAFHIAISGEAYVVPTILINHFELWPHGLWAPKPGRAIVKFLPPIKATKEMTVDELSARSRQAILDGLEEVKKNPRPLQLSGPNKDPLGYAISVLIGTAALWFAWRS